MNPSPQSDTPPDPLDTTADLLLRVRHGDGEALERLLRTFTPLLSRWAHGRLPTNARGLSDTDDLVQITLIRVLDRLKGFDARHPGAFLAYLRRALLNNMRNEIRYASRRPRGEPPHENLPQQGRSPLEQAIGQRALDAYEEALGKLGEAQKAAVILRLEMGCRYPSIAEMLGMRSANAARMTVSRALVRLADLIDEDVVRDVCW